MGERLQLVLNPSRADAERGDKEPQPPNIAPLADRLRTVRHFINRTTAIAEDLRNRVEV